MTLCAAGHPERADDCPACAALCDTNEAALWADAARTDDAPTLEPEPMEMP